MKIFLVVTWPLIANSFHLADASVELAGYLQGEELRANRPLDIILIPIIITNLTIVNYFQLKVSGIAAIQRCTTREQELTTLKQLRWAMILYLPFFFVLTAAQYTCEFLFLNGIQHKNGAYLDKIRICIIAFNAAKVLLTGVLCYTSLRFASELKKKSKAFIKEYGIENPHVSRV